MRHQKQFVPRSDVSLDHERRGTAWNLSTEGREEAARGLEVLGYVEDAAILRAMNDRLPRRSQIHAVPDDPRRPLKSTPDRPILRALDGAQAPASADDARRGHMRRMALLIEQGAASSWATPTEKVAWRAAASSCRRAAIR